MTFKSKSPKGLSRATPLRSKSPMKAGQGFAKAPPSPAEQRKAQQKALQKTTLRLLEKARQDADAQNVDLSEWESEFIDSVSERVKTYGRAFADPDKGAAGGTLSMRQGVKLKEIRRKVRDRGAQNTKLPKDE